MSRLTASRAAFDLIQSFEGYRARSARLSNGGWTLGFGHTATAREGLSVTRQEAEDLLRWDLRPVEDVIRQTALSPLTQHQFDALVSFVFNIGIENFKGSDVLRHINQGQPIAAALALQAWRRARVNGRLIIVDALVRRRAAEAALFLEAVGPRPAAPSPVVAPEIDYAAALLAQPGPTHAVNAPLDGDVTEASAESGDAEGNGTQLETVATTIADTDMSAAQSEPDKAVQSDLAATPSIRSVPERSFGGDKLVSPIGAPSDAKLEAEAPVLPEAQSESQFEGQSDALATQDQGIINQGTPSGPQTLGARRNTLLPFPGSEAEFAANASRAELASPMIANDQAELRSDAAPPQHGLRTAPEELASPLSKPDMPPDMSWGRVLLWALTGLGAVLMVAGIWYSIQSGFSLSAGSSPLSAAQTNAILASTGGFLIFVSCGLGLWQMRNASHKSL